MDLWPQFALPLFLVVWIGHGFRNHRVLVFAISGWKRLVVGLAVAFTLHVGGFWG